MHAARSLASLALTLALAAGCGAAPGADAPSPYIPGFTPPATPAGYQRFVTPILTGLPSGSDTIRCQWIMAPPTEDMYVTAVAGEQSKGGHHIVLYANKVVEDVGTSRDCTVDDMLQIGFLGAIGGEGMSTTSGQIPDGVAFKLPKGRALMANTHFINATPASFDGQGVIDVKFVDRAAVKQVADLFTSLNTTFEIPAGKAGTADANCVFGADMSFFRFANHMHGYGSSVYSEVVHGDGSKQDLVRDDHWLAEQMFDFRFENWPLDKPLVIKKGETLHTHCEWQNSTAGVLSFPSEMCVIFGFFVPGSGGQIVCQDGSWPSGR